MKAEKVLKFCTYAKSADIEVYDRITAIIVRVD